MDDTKTKVVYLKENALANEVGNIVTRLQAGEDVFQEFYEKTKKYVYYIATSNGVSPIDAEDVVQETFVHFFKKYNEIQDPKSALAWLKRSAFGHAIDSLKKKKDVCLAKDEDTEFDIFDTDALMQPMDIPESALDRKESARIISEIVNNLPEDQKKCVLAYYYSECKIKDIATTYGVPENTVKTNLHRGRKNIEAQLAAFSKKYGIKIVSVAVIPFFSLAIAEKANACELYLSFGTVAQAAGVGKAAGLANAVVGTGTKAMAGAGAKVAGTKTVAAGAIKAASTGAAKAVATKVAIAVISVGAIGGGAVAATNYANAVNSAVVEEKQPESTQDAFVTALMEQESSHDPDEKSDEALRLEQIFQQQRLQEEASRSPALQNQVAVTPQSSVEQAAPSRAVTYIEEPEEESEEDETPIRESTGRMEAQRVEAQREVPATPEPTPATVNNTPVISKIEELSSDPSNYGTIVTADGTKYFIAEGGSYYNENEYSIVWQGEPTESFMGVAYAHINSTGQEHMLKYNPILGTKQYG